MKSHKYSGVYTSAYSFFNQHPETKLEEWDDVQVTDCDDIADAVGSKYIVLFAGQWSYEVLNNIANLLGHIEYGVGLSSDQDILVVHETQYITAMRELLDYYGLDIDLLNKIYNMEAKNVM